MIVIIVADVQIACSQRTHRVLETSHPPVYYVPPADIQMANLVRSDRASFCEWKGRAVYYDLQFGNRLMESVAWSYPDPTAGFLAIRDHLAFYPSRVDACYVDDERVQAQAGDFYGGWITRDIVGPFKGAPGTMGW